MWQERPPHTYLLDVEHHTSLADPRVLENLSERESLTGERAFRVAARISAVLGGGGAVGTVRTGFVVPDRRLQVLVVSTDWVACVR